MKPALALVALLGALLSESPPQRAVADAFELGVEAYRAGDHARAGAIWRDLLAQDLGPDARARLLYDLGNASYRQGRELEAIGYYTACLELAPRHADAWANLELVRSGLGLEPADRGDLRSTVRRLADVLRPEESRLLVAAVLGVLALLLLGEALRGGRAWQLSALSCLLAGALLAVPWARSELRRGEDRLLVLAIPEAELRSEPRAELPVIARLEPCGEVERVDELPGWVRVETAEGVRGWLPQDQVFPLAPR